MNHFKNILVAVALMVICYYFGYTLGGAYDNTNDYKDILSIGCGIGSIIWLIKKYA
jgi:hypothetical protein